MRRLVSCTRALHVSGCSHGPAVGAHPDGLDEVLPGLLRFVILVYALAPPGVVPDAERVETVRGLGRDLDRLLEPGRVERGEPAGTRWAEMAAVQLVSPDPASSRSGAYLSAGVFLSPHGDACLGLAGLVVLSWCAGDRIGAHLRFLRLLGRCPAPYDLDTSLIPAALSAIAYALDSDPENGGCAVAQFADDCAHAARSLHVEPFVAERARYAARLHWLAALLYLAIGRLDPWNVELADSVRLAGDGVDPLFAAGLALVCAANAAHLGALDWLAELAGREHRDVWSAAWGKQPAVLDYAARQACLVAHAQNGLPLPALRALATYVTVEIREHHFPPGSRHELPQPDDSAGPAGNC